MRSRNWSRNESRGPADGVSSGNESPKRRVFREIAQRRVFDFGSLGPYFNIESEYPQSGSQEGLRIPRSCVSIVAATVSLRRLATGADTAHAKTTLVFLSERRSERLYAWQGAARPHGVLPIPYLWGRGAPWRALACVAGRRSTSRGAARRAVAYRHGPARNGTAERRPCAPRSVVASAVFAAAAPRTDPRLLLLVEPLLHKPLLGDLLACGCGGLVVLGELRVAHLMREAISGNQWSSVVISGLVVLGELRVAHLPLLGRLELAFRQPVLEVGRDLLHEGGSLPLLGLCNHRPPRLRTDRDRRRSEVIRGHQRSSEVINGPIGIEGAQRAIGGRIRGQAEGTQRAIRGHSEGTQRRRTCSDLWRLPCGASCLGFDLNGSAACSAFGMTSGLKRRVERSMGL